ncbi:MAG TPA: sulfite exporter TauE/SafE family protein [Sedimentisphaerales bacterium]|nr:sulfite exporter TauE/SafE family protein [Sedimentisphaerales bacterium]
MDIVLCVILGLVAGIFSGFLGIGGAVIIIPALIFMFGMSQHLAQGTALALMVLPIGFLAALTYFKNGYVDFKVAAFVALGFFIGGLLGARFAVHTDAAMLKKAFGILLLMISLKMIFMK